MSDAKFISLKCKGIDVHVNLTHVADDWTGDHDTRFDVKIAGQTTHVPGIWNAYQKLGVDGVQLVVCAYIDSKPHHLGF